jgi:peptidoglycan/xylan/chitin deacetylase (PgdA/CDA1 family)
VRSGGAVAQTSPHRGLVRRAYYFLRPLLGTSVRKYLQRASLRGWEQRPFPAWPVDQTVERILQHLLLLAMKATGRDRIPFIWFWPDGKSACAVMTHDVETRAGLEYCPRLMDLNDAYGIKSSFQLVPVGRYRVPAEILEEIRTRGFEINAHDWNHDGFLFADHETFLKRAEKINQFAAEVGAKGFRSGALYRNPDWYAALSFDYDMSIPNVGHLDPQSGGCCTVMPYFIGRILEIPVTAIQDYSLFHFLSDYSLSLWRQQLELITKAHGVANFIVHPDYIIEDKARATYSDLLEYLVQLRSKENVWIALPGEVNCWWRERNAMKLVQCGGNWRIVGAGSGRARIAHAVSDGKAVTYTLD